jgi:hypothetical protein
MHRRARNAVLGIVVVAVLAIVTLLQEAPAPAVARYNPFRPRPASLGEPPARGLPLSTVGGQHQTDK